jgi:hypothetical protein
MKSPISTFSNLWCFYHMIPNLLTMKSPVYYLSNPRCLYHSICNVFTMTPLISSLSNLPCLYHYTSNIFTMKYRNLFTTISPKLSPLHLQSFHYEISQFFTMQSIPSPNILPALSSHTPISAALATFLSRNQLSRTVNRWGYERQWPFGNTTEQWRNLCWLKAGPPQKLTRLLCLCLRVYMCACVPDVSFGVETKLLLVYLTTPPAVIASESHGTAEILATEHEDTRFRSIPRTSLASAKDSANCRGQNEHHDVIPRRLPDVAGPQPRSVLFPCLHNKAARP